MVKKLIAAYLVLLSTSLYAIDWDSQSLVGLEFGYGKMKVEGKSSKQPSYSKNFNVMPIGIKLGAKNKSSRLFFSARYLYIPDFDFSSAYGTELQYLFPMGKVVNLFLGANTGLVSLNFNPHNFNSLARSNNRSATDYYFGGDAGINLNFSSSFALELGARYIHIDITHIKSLEKYTLNPITQGYLSFIYKYYSSK